MRVLAFAVMLFCSSTALAEEERTPQLDGARIAGEVLTAGAVSVIGVVGGGFFGVVVGFAACDGSDCLVTAGALGVTGGIALTAPIGVYLVGDDDEETGSVGAAVLGGVVGGCAGGATWFVMDHTYAVPFMVGLPIIGATVGFNLTREYKHQRKTALIPTAAVSHERAMFGFAGSF